MSVLHFPFRSLRLAKNNRPVQELTTEQPGVSLLFPIKRQLPYSSPAPFAA
jgi:hypothetical protein